MDILLFLGSRADDPLTDDKLAQAEKQNKF
jgi:hypothetical protein